MEDLNFLGCLKRLNYPVEPGRKEEIQSSTDNWIIRDDMDIAKSIRDLRESTGMSRKEFSEHTGIPVRTLEDWEAGRRTPPEYIPRLIAYQLKYEELIKGREEDLL